MIQEALFWQVVTRCPMHPWDSTCVFYSGFSWQQKLLRFLVFQSHWLERCYEKWGPGGQPELEQAEIGQNLWQARHDPPVFPRTPVAAMPHSAEHTMVREGATSVSGIPLDSTYFPGLQGVGSAQCWDQPWDQEASLISGVSWDEGSLSMPHSAGHTMQWWGKGWLSLLSPCFLVLSGVR